MSAVLRLGLAGLGTVGASLLRSIELHGAEFAERTGRRLEVVAISARDRGKTRSADISKLKWVDDPLAIANNPDVDVFIELMGGAGGKAEEAVRAALSA